MNRFSGALLLSAAALLIGDPHIARAQGDAARIKALEQRLEQSLERIDALEGRVKELEAQQPANTAQSAAASKPSGAAATNERLDTLENQVVALNQANAARHIDESSLPIHGFAGVNAGNRNQNFPDERGFNIAELDFYLTPSLGTHTRSLFELNFETDHDGGVGVDLERAQVGYQFNDAATVWVGRFHTPYGYYNTAFHHGRWLMNGVRRPRFMEFEDKGGTMPAHTVGAWLTGGRSLSDGKLNYDVYFGNSQRIVETQGGTGEIDMNNVGNPHGNMMVGGRLGFTFGGALDGLLVGVDAFSTRIGDDQVVPNLTRVRSYGAFVALDTDTWQLVSELHFFDNDDLSGNTGSHRSEAGFIDLAYRFERLAPYLRWERAALQQADAYFAQQLFGNSYDRTALGLRFDLDSKSVLKVELAHTEDTDRLRDQYNDALLQYAIRF